MAARTRKTELTDAWREKIQASMLVNRLKDHVDGKISLSPTQIKAAEILLSKLVPSLSAVEQTNIESRDTADPAELQAKLRALYDQHPRLFEFIKATCNVESGEAANDTGFTVQ